MTRAGLIQPAIRPSTSQTRGREESNQAPVGRDARARKAKKGKKKGKAKDKGGVGASLGIGVGGLDGWEEEDEGQRRKRRSAVMIGEDEGVMFADNDADAWEPMASVAPEFLPQVSAGMATARSLTSGTTMPSKRKSKSKTKSKPDS